MSIGSVHIDLLEHVELDTEAGSKLFDLTAVARLLGSELVAGEGEDGQLTLGLEKCISLRERERERERWRLVSPTLLYLSYNSTN